MINTAKVEAGAKVVVFGLGGIGLNVVQGARMVGAEMIVGVDLNPKRRELAEKFGMTHFVNPKEVQGRPGAVSRRPDQGRGLRDYSFECIGNVADDAPGARNAAIAAGGSASSSALAGAGQEISTRHVSSSVTGRIWKGTAFGGARGRTDAAEDRRLVYGRQG